MSKIEYRFIKSSWGIAIDIAGNHECFENQPSVGKMIAPKIWLEIVDDKLNESERNWIEKGLKTVDEKILSKITGSKSILIKISEVSFNPCDYQPEGLFAAIIEWTSKEFDFEKPKINIEFDKKQNKYLIN
jgi:hypothetical protein